MWAALAAVCPEGIFPHRMIPQTGKRESLVHSGHRCHDVTVTAGGTAILIMHQGSWHHSRSHTIQGGGSTRGSKANFKGGFSWRKKHTHLKKRGSGRRHGCFSNQFLSKKNHLSVFLHQFLTWNSQSTTDPIPLTVQLTLAEKKNPLV